MHTYYYQGEINEFVTLSPEESNHAIKVMRSKQGDEVIVINGEGVKAIAKIVDPHHKRCVLEVQNKEEFPEDKPLIFIAISPTKSNDRIEFFLEKATEVGVDGVIPLMAKNNERTKVNLDRWNKVVLSAVKQSKRAWKPKVFEPMKVDELLGKDWSGFDKLIAYCEDLPEKSITTFVTSSNDKLLLIGPEGDFTLEEVESCEKAGFERVNLGENRLRTETAGIVGATLLKINTD